MSLRHRPVALGLTTLALTSLPLLPLPVLPLPLLQGAALAGPEIEHRVVVLQGLDKVTARISELEVPLTEEIHFGSLVIRARACLETPPTEPPESAAFLEIDEVAGEAEPRSAFVGWMFASTPAISALEHPVYDVWVIDCREPYTVPLRIDPLPVE